MIIEFEEQLLELIDTRISTASDDEFFAGGYLRGHISLSAAECEEEGINDEEKLKASLDATRLELTSTDRAIVNDLWVELANQA